MPKIFSGLRNQTRACLEVASVLVLTRVHIIQLRWIRERLVLANNQGLWG